MVLCRRDSILSPPDFSSMVSGTRLFVTPKVWTGDPNLKSDLTVSILNGVTREFWFQGNEVSSTCRLFFDESGLLRDSCVPVSMEQLKILECSTKSGLYKEWCGVQFDMMNKPPLGYFFQYKNALLIVPFVLDTSSLWYYVGEIEFFRDFRFWVGLYLWFSAGLFLVDRVRKLVLWT